MLAACCTIKKILMFVRCESIISPDPYSENKPVNCQQILHHQVVIWKHKQISRPPLFYGAVNLYPHRQLNNQRYAWLNCNLKETNFVTTSYFYAVVWLLSSSPISIDVQNSPGYLWSGQILYSIIGQCKFC